MRYHYKKPTICEPLYGDRYYCDHEVYTYSTLFKINNIGLSVIQQRYDNVNKTTWWGEIDQWLRNDIYLNPLFKQYFDSRAGICINGVYPTVTIRQIMWALKMKPLKKEKCETVFDRRDV